MPAEFEVDNCFCWVRYAFSSLAFLLRSKKNTRRKITMKITTIATMTKTIHSGTGTSFEGDEDAESEPHERSVSLTITSKPESKYRGTEVTY